MSNKHGVYTSEVPTSVKPPFQVFSSLPVMVGSAPINLARTPKINEPILCYTFADVVEHFGFEEAVNGKHRYSICEFADYYFRKVGASPAVIINVLDDANADHVSAASETITATVNQYRLAARGVLISSLVVTSGGEESTTYTVGTHYEAAYDKDGYVVITRKTTASMPNTVNVAFSELSPTTVTDDDIIGGVDSNGKRTGLELIDEVYPRFGLVPANLVCSHSNDAAVAAVMSAKVKNINGGLFKGLALSDLGTVSATSAAGAIAAKGTANIVDSHQLACWPEGALGGVSYRMSFVAAAAMAATDAANGGVPYVSPSNKAVSLDGTTTTETPIFIGPQEANLLNANGIVTALNSTGGFRLWGNRTAAYPGNTDVKDSLIPIRRMFNWVANTLTLTFLNNVDAPLNRRNLDIIVDSANIWLNSLVAAGQLLGARVEFRQEDNAATALMDGTVKFRVFITPPSPMENIEFMLEYDVNALETLFG